MEPHFLIEWRHIVTFKLIEICICLLQELEAIEEQWRNERIELVALVNRLQEENRRIQKLHESPSHESSLIGSDDDKMGKDDSQANLLSASDFQVMQRLRSQIERQREEIKSRDEKLQQENNELESVSLIIDWNVIV